MEGKKMFEVNGSFFDGKQSKAFSKKVNAVNEKTAKDFVYCLIGSKHKCKRKNININAVNAVKEA